jgi:flagellar hook-associated protein 2
MAIQSTGVGSGLDVDGIVSQLMALERRPLDALATKKAGITAKLSAYGSLKSVLASLQAAASTLSGAQKFLAVKASFSDATVATASAVPPAAAGSYGIEVQQLAQAQKLKSAAFASTSTSLGAGSLTIEFGSYSGGSFALNPDKAAASVTIAPGQDSLAAVRDALNAANAGISAGIVNDGSGQRLVVTSTDSGAQNSLRITVNDADGNHTDAAGLSRLAYDASAGGTMRLAETVAAQDALVSIDGIDVVSATNTLSGAIDGVTLNLAKAAPGTVHTLTVARDVDSAKAAVDAFVKGYNDAAKALKSLSAYDAGTKTAGALQGDSTLISVQTRLRSTLSAAVEFSGGYGSLSELGIAFQKDGTLLADATKLRAALADTSKDAASAFAAIGTASDSLVKYSSATASAAAGSYALQVTQLGTRGNAAGSAPAALTITAGVNDALQVSVDGTVQNVTLAAGSYTASSLAAMLQTRITGIDVTESGGVLTLTSKTWGSASTVAVTGGNAMADLFGVPASTGGVNAAGTIGGVAATGAGRNLSAKGLTVTIEGGATGARGTLRFSRGAADRLNSLIDGFLDETIAARTDGIGQSIKSMDLQKTRLEARMESVEKRLRAQFISLDSMIASMSGTSSFLSQQLANLPKIGSAT